MVEDLVNVHELYHHSRLLQRHAEGQQAGAMSHKAALPPLLSFGLSIDEHFQQSLTLGHQPLPTERPPLLDDDLWFCAEQHWRPPTELYALRKRAIGAIKELEQRWGPVTAQLRRLQTPAIRRVTATRDLGLTALLIMLLSWAGRYDLPIWFDSGYASSGDGVFPVQQGREITMAEVLDGWQDHNYHIIKQLKPGPHDSDASQGFCTKPLTHAQLHPGCPSSLDASSFSPVARSGSSTMGIQVGNPSGHPIATS